MINSTDHIDLSYNFFNKIKKGDNIYNSDYFKLIAEPDFEVSLSIPYAYDDDRNILTLYSNDIYNSDKSKFLSIKKVGNNEIIGKLNLSDNKDKINISNINGNILSSLKIYFLESIDNIIEKSKEKFSILRLVTKAPILTKDEIELIFDIKNEKNIKFSEFDNINNYIGSIWGGEAYFRRYENIANVIGSSNDPLISSKAWIEIWERQFGLEDSCTSHGWASGNSFSCNDSSRSNIVGGHVIEGTVAKSMPDGSNSVYIIPICKSHNNNDNVFMRADVYTQAIWLNNYNKK